MSRTALEDLAASVDRLVERRVRERVAVVEASYAAREADLVSRVYRRGYLRGYRARERGRPEEAAPEQTTRGEIREILDRAERLSERGPSL